MMIGYSDVEMVGVGLGRLTRLVSATDQEGRVESTSESGEARERVGLQ